MKATLNYVGGPTALIEVGGVRLLTDPTFDAPGTSYPGNGYTLHKTAGPALARAALGRVDAVLLSHDHHADNLDHEGRASLADVPVVLTTIAAAVRLGGNARGLADHRSAMITAPDGRRVRVTATPARHGPAGGDRGPVIGFLLELDDPAEGAIYVSGDTVWYDDVEAVARRHRVTLALLFLGAAHVAAAGPSHLTFTAAEAVAAARAFAGATIAPLHYEGWAHFAESRREVDAAFAAAGLAQRLAWLPAGQPRAFELAGTRATADAGMA